MSYLLMAGSVEVKVSYELIPFAYGQLKALMYKQIFIMHLGGFPMWIITWENFCEDEDRLYDPRFDIYSGM